MVFIQLRLPSLIKEELELCLVGICVNLKIQFPPCTGGWWMLRAHLGQTGYKHGTHEILEEKIASNTAAELEVSYFAVLRGSSSIH